MNLMATARHQASRLDRESRLDVKRERLSLTPCFKSIANGELSNLGSYRQVYHLIDDLRGYIPMDAKIYFLQVLNGVYAAQEQRYRVTDTFIGFWNRTATREPFTMQFRLQHHLACIDQCGIMKTPEIMGSFEREAFDLSNIRTSDSPPFTRSISSAYMHPSQS
jgi:hypothetical protein